MTYNESPANVPGAAHPAWDSTPPAQQPAPTAKPGWSKGKTAAVAAAAIVAAVAATGGIAYAAGSSNSGTTAQAGAGGQGPGGMPGGVGPSGVPQGGTNQGGTAPGAGNGPGGAAGGLMNALHGGIVVQSGSGYATEEIQTGTVTTVSATSITVASADGYTRTYLIGSSTTVDNGADKVSGLATGHTVSIEATVSGSTLTATEILDRTLRQQSGGQPPTN